MRDLRRSRRRQRAAALALIAPLALFLAITFVMPIVALLARAVENPEVAATLPKTVAALVQWDRKEPPTNLAYAALAEDLRVAKRQGNSGALAQRLNLEIPGARSLLIKTVRAIPLLGADGAPLPTGQSKQALIDLDERWGQTEYWQVIAKNSSSLSAYYLLAATDLKQDAFGQVHRVGSDQSIYTTIFARTFGIGLVVTLCCLAIGYPLAYWLSTLPPRRANLLMILVLVPFWTSVLVRITAWIVLLQSAGLVNNALLTLNLTQAPLELVFNRFGVYVSMTHILLPFMILPLYSVMKSIPPTFVRAAVSLGSHPFSAFWRVYVPQTFPGISAGVLLVFILALGYYITPALLGGPNEQLVSYYVAYFTNVSLNWGMASALGSLLLVATLLLYSVYRRVAPSGVSF